MKSLRLGMTSLFLVAFMCFFCSTAIAQDILMEENFNDGYPDGWTGEQAADSNGWQWADEISGSSTYWEIPPSQGIEGNAFMVSNDDECNCDMSMDYFISPAIDLTSAAESGARLNFSAFMTGLWNSRGLVEVSTDGGDSWETIYELDAQTFWQEVALNLDAYTGSDQFHVRFWHDDSGAWASGFAIDNFVISTPMAYDLRIDKVVVPNEYSFFPKSEWEHFGDFTIELTNGGYEVRNNLAMLMTIQYFDQELGELITQEELTSDPIESLSGGESATITIPNTYEVGDTGIYIFNYFLSSDEDEEELNGFDNLKVFTSYITEGKFGRAIDFVDIITLDEEGNAGLDFSFTQFNLAGTGAYGSSFEAFDDTQLAGINFEAFGPDGADWGEVQLVVYEMDDLTVGSEFYTYGPYQPTPDEVDGAVHTVNFDCPIELPTGKYFVSIEVLDGSDLGMICSTQRNTPGESLTLSDAGEWVGTGVSSGAVIPKIYAIMGGSSEAADEISYTYEITGLTVDLTGAANGINCEWSWDFGNGDTADSGSSASYSYSEPGDYEICVFGENGLEYCETISVQCSLGADLESALPNEITIAGTGGAGYTYEWADNDETGETITGLEPGTTYTVVVSDDSGCVSDELEFSTPACSLDFTMGQEQLPNGNVQWAIQTIDNPFSEPISHDVVWTDADGNEVGSGLEVNLDPSEIEGGATYTATVTDEYGCEASMSFEGLSVNIEEVQGLQSFEFYPNPSQGMVQVNIELDRSVEFTMNVFNVAGELVFQTTENNMSRFSQDIDLSDLAAGVYMVQFAFDSAIATERLIISK